MGSDWVLTVDGVPLQESAEPPAPSALRGPRADQELVFARHARAAACVSEAWPPEPRQRALGGLQGRVGSGVSVRAARYRSAGAHSAPGRREAPTRPRRKPLQCSPGHGGVSFKGRAQPGPPSPEPGASGEKPAGRCAEPVGLGRLRTRLGPRGHRESRATTGASGGASPPGDKRPGGGRPAARPSLGSALPVPPASTRPPTAAPAETPALPPAFSARSVAPARSASEGPGRPAISSARRRPARGARVGIERNSRPGRGFLRHACAPRFRAQRPRTDASAHASSLWGPHIQSRGGGGWVHVVFQACDRPVGESVTCPYIDRSRRAAPTLLSLWRLG